jgi:hypothetical protein
VIKYFINVLYVTNAPLSGRGPPSIPLSWVHPAEPNLRVKIFQEVKQTWFHILPKIVMRHTKRQHESDLWSLVAAIERLDFSAFSVDDALGFINFINWIASEVSCCFA